MNDVLRTGPLMQIVNILRNDGHVTRESLSELRECDVCRVRLYVEELSRLAS